MSHASPTFTRDMMKQLAQQLSPLIAKWGITPLYADACGNTFLIIDCINRDFKESKWQSFKEEIWALLPSLSVDDALVLRKIEGQMVKMHVLEPDGTEADFCGNGARAVGVYLHKTKREYPLQSRRGEHPFKYEDRECYVSMGTPLLNPKIMTYKGYTLKFVDCVEPHLVTEDIFDADLLTALGNDINRDWKEFFPHGINVNCMRKAGNTVEVLTYERGLYRITAACGTGSTACVRTIQEEKNLYLVKVPGGELRIHRGKDGTYWLGGPVLILRIF